MTSLKRSGDPIATNISSKTFVRSTKSGKVQKIVKEVYLRQDIPCSSKLCSVCFASAPTDANGFVSPFVLSENPASTKKFTKGHYLIPDTNALLNGIDLFEQSAAFFDVIILQTVLEEMRNRSLPLYNRIIALTKSDDKHFYVFFNDFRRDTYVVREQGESINDRNDRAVRRAVSWYTEHLQQALKPNKRAKQAPAIIMLSDDKDNLRKAISENITACSLSNYVSGLEDADRLLDMVSSSLVEQNSKRSAAEQVYPDYFSVSRMMTGIKAGTLHQGIFNVSPYNYLEGTVNVPAFDKSLLILGRENSNRAVSDDLVVVEVLPKPQWKAPSNKIIEEDSLNRNDNAEMEEGEGEAVVTEQERRALQEEVKRTHGRNIEGRAQPTARVVGIIRRNWRQYVGHVDSNSTSNAHQSRKQQTVFLLPMDKRIPKIRLRTRQAEALVGKRIVVTIDAWEQDSRYPVGHLVRSLGDLETQGAETEALLLEYDVQYRPFSKGVLDCLPPEGHDWKVPGRLDDPGWKGRRDLRDLLICSIDPVGCQDIDDALHARVMANGNYEVGVHIADVSHFVKPGNAMDAESSLRGTTVYLVDKRIDMLPMLLGTDLCSLKPYVERYAFSTIWEITRDAKIVNSTFTKSVIRSREAFSYEQAQLRIDDKSQQDDLTKGMRILLVLSKKLKAARMSAGALNLASPEVRIQTDSETSDPVDVRTKELLDTNSLVEEFMLLANISVASKIYSAFPQTALLRRHAAPPSTNFEELSNQLKVKRDLTLRTESSKALADSLDACTDPKEPFFNTLIRILATRCMMSAEYFCSGTHSYPEFRHYGLASEIYTHFTSPIRRYADLEAHRQLAVAIGYEPLDSSLLSKHKLEDVCKNINVRHRNAQMAGRASIEYYVGQALKGHVVVEEGFVMRVFENGFVVFVPRFGIEGLIRLRELASPEPQGAFDAEEYVLRIEGRGIGETPLVVELFQKVSVRISDFREEGTGKRKAKMELVR
ncbi:MAG: hypothetical protein Q9217_000982 [Psora testacea]